MKRLIFCALFLALAVPVFAADSIVITIASNINSVAGNDSITVPVPLIPIFLKVTARENRGHPGDVWTVGRLFQQRFLALLQQYAVEGRPLSSAGDASFCDGYNAASPAQRNQIVTITGGAEPPC